MDIPLSFYCKWIVFRYTRGCEFSKSSLHNFYAQVINTKCLFLRSYCFYYLCNDIDFLVLEPFPSEQISLMALKCQQWYLI